MVKKKLAQIQYDTFTSGSEFCGYIGRHTSGALTFTDIVKGSHNGCTPDLDTGGLELIASIHTHGTYAPDVPAEFPTVRDMTSDRSEGVNGYIATPGGRLWYIDSTAMIAAQLCGVGCLPQDPAFHLGDDGPIANRYTYQELKDLEGPFWFLF